MRRKIKIILPILIVVAIIVALTLHLHSHTVDVLQPAGPIGHKERGLMIFALSLAVIVVVPTFALTIYIAWKYREENHGATTKYSPDFDHSRLFETIWWGIPIIIIGILSVVAWNSAHSLDPYKKLASDKKTVTIQVVSMDWKWLFIYPEQHVASVNLAAIPVGTPVEFQVTSDTVMNSFWVPQLGGQIYSMPGMITQLHLQADKPGDYFGSPANIAGKGFSRMNFTVRAVSQNQYQSWLQTVAAAPQELTVANYDKLSKPSDSVPVTYYSAVPDNLYNAIAMQYMMPGMSLKNTAGKITASTESAAAGSLPATTLSVEADNSKTDMNTAVPTTTTQSDATSASPALPAACGTQTIHYAGTYCP